jgi:copper chaperone CopZ
MIRKAFLIFAALAMAVPSAQATTSPDRVYEVETSLMSCAVCRKKIKEVLEGVEGVKSVEWDLTAKKAIVTMNGDKTLTLATLEKAFKDTKYIVNTCVEKKVAESKPAVKPAGS